MKYLLVVLVVGLVLAWLMRRSRVDSKVDRSSTTRPAEMVRCAHCGVHLPAQDALTERDLVFCSEVHKRAGPR